MKRARKVFKTLKLTPKGSSGTSDVSENHDRYLVEAEMAAAKRAAIARKGYLTCPVPIISYFEEVNLSLIHI